MTPRKKRTDKGVPRPTERDPKMIKWIAEQEEVSAHQLGILLARYSTHTEEPTVSDPAVSQQINRWELMELAERRNVYGAKESVTVYATAKGIREAGYSFDPRPPHIWHKREHRLAINWVRLWMGLWIKQQGLTWKWVSERQLKHEHREWGEMGPDAEVTYGDPEATIAIQVEISSKTDAEYARLIRLYSGETVDGKTFPRSNSYAQIWYFVSPSIEARLSKIFANYKDRFHVVSLGDKQLEDGSTFPY